MERMRDQLIPTKRLKAIKEELAGFSSSEVLKKTGEFYHKSNYFFASNVIDVISTCEKHDVDVVT